MVREIMLYTSNDLRDFMHLACASPLDIGVHTMDNQIADGKSGIGTDGYRLQKTSQGSFRG